MPDPKNARVTQLEKKAMISAYLAETERKSVIAVDFVDYVQAAGPPHVFWDHLFEHDDSHCAREYRAEMVRGMISGLREEVFILTPTMAENKAAKGPPTKIIRRGSKTPKAEIPDGFTELVTTIPFMLSMQEDRLNGGGYTVFNWTDDKLVADFDRQAVIDIGRDFRRYQSTLVRSGIDPSRTNSILTEIRQMIEREKP